MRRIIGILLTLTMVLSTFVSVSAEESTLLSVGKPVEAGILGSGSVASDVAGHGAVEVMVDGVTGGDAGTVANKLKMWFLHSTNTSDTIYLNVDLEDAYVITSVNWRSRYPSTPAQDYQGMKIYGANKADYSDKVEIYNVGTDVTDRDAEFTLDTVGEYRYIRFEKTRRMGGQELYIYGYKNSQSNANLSSLAVEGYEFDSAFDASDEEYTVISDGFPTDNTVTVTAAAELEGATASGIGSVKIENYGINVIPIMVTAPTGIAKTYKINFIVTDIQDISSGVTASGSGVIYSGTSKNDLVLDDSYCTDLFTSKVARWKVHIKYANTGYIQADLGKAYNLHKFTYTKSNLEPGKELVVKAANNPDFSDGVTVGNVAALAAKSTSASAILDSTNSYRYIRIEKNNIKHDFLPTSMRLYAMPDIVKVTEGGTTTVTIPSLYYAAGDQITTVIYNSDGSVKSKTVQAAPNAESVTVSVTRADEEAAKISIFSSDGETERKTISIENQITISPAVAAYNGEEITSLAGVAGEVTVTKEIVSNKTTAEYVVPVAAIKDINGNFYKIAIGEKQKIAQSEEDGDITISIDIPQNSDTKDLYLYLWDGISTMMPFTKSEPVIIGNSAKLYLMGDSLCAKYDASIAQRGWGMYMQDEFDAHIEVVNCAKGGNKLSDVMAEENAAEYFSWETIKSKLVSGDYVFVNLGYNERKSSDFTQYKADLATIYNEGKALGVTVIFVTPSLDVSTNAGVTVSNSTLNVTAAMKEAAAELGAACLDLNTAIWNHYQTMSPDDDSLQIVKDTYYLSKAYLASIGITDPATQGWSAAIRNNGQDLVHMNEAGAKLLSSTIADLLTKTGLQLGKFVK